MAKTSKQKQSKKYLWLSLVGVAAIAAAAVFFWPKANTSNAQGVPDEQLLMGETIFKANCASCHGLTGQGHQAIKEAPALNGSEHSWHHADSQIKTLIRTGGVKMPAVGKDFSDEEIAAVMVYYKQWWGKQQRIFQEKVSKQNP